jgi:prolyl-tRNA synthetase
MAEKITPRSEDYARWYTDVIQKADLASYAPVRGCMVIKPYGFALWENLQSYLNRRFKETGHENAYFPLFIPESFIKKEAEHVEGFAPELAVVTIGGGEQLEEPLIVRPTSETIIGYFYAQWIHSYRDLPLLINQWANVVRWEMRPRLFLRTTEFLWQEGHTAHATAEEAEAETLMILDIYREFAEEQAAIPVIPGRKSESERFAGALRSYTIEAMMGDKRALQSATSHNLGQNFAKAFDIQYLDANNQQQYCYTTSWGMSTRMIGAMIMVHGDDAGLKMPPRLAPIQAVIVPIGKSDEEKAAVMPVARQVFEELHQAGIRVKLDDREGFTPGFKFNDWEMRGVPVRVEIGPKDVQNHQVMLARRDKPGKEGKTIAGLNELASGVQNLLDEIHHSLYEAALEFQKANTHHVSSYEQLKEVVQDGFAVGWWAGSSEDEARIKDETKATIRCVPLEQPSGTGKCFYTGKEAKEVALFARAY